MSTTLRGIAAGTFFLLIFLSGLWLSRRGRPLHAGISALHKLISLGAGIFMGVTIHQLNQTVPLSATEWTAVALAGLFTAGTIASGGVLSFERPVPVAVLRMHQIMPVLTALSCGAVLYLLLGPVLGA